MQPLLLAKPIGASISCEIPRLRSGGTASKLLRAASSRCLSVGAPILRQGYDMTSPEAGPGDRRRADYESAPWAHVRERRGTRRSAEELRHIDARPRNVVPKVLLSPE